MSQKSNAPRRYPADAGRGDRRSRASRNAPTISQFGLTVEYQGRTVNIPVSTDQYRLLENLRYRRDTVRLAGTNLVHARHLARLGIPMEIGQPDAKGRASVRVKPGAAISVQI